jgi:hypothetical protein
MDAEFLGLTPKECVVKCRKSVAEAQRSAATASGEARTAYLNLARQWSILADEIENGISAPGRSD